jgi:hypothetical protein
MTKRAGKIMTNHKRSTNACAAALSLLMFAPSAFAYLDPSTGSMILSAVVGLFATAALAVKTYWYKLKSFFRADRSDEPVSTQERPAESENSAES